MKLILKILFLFSSLAFAQQQASNWYFGYNAGVKFNSNGTVTALTDGQLFTLEGCATLSDTNGNLLFYTDGVTIFNKNHQQMPNGNNLMGDSSTTQSATIVPMPGSATLFYVFTLDAFAGANGFRYSVVDMAVNGGLGAVTAAKNVLIYSPSGEKIAIVKHANGTDYWVVTHGWNNNTFYSYLLTSTGVSNTPVVSNLGAFIGGLTNNVWGYMKISPNGKKLAVCNSQIDFELFDFDSSTGSISNLNVLRTVDLTTTNFDYGVEFSPDSTKLYLSVLNLYPSLGQIFQYDLNSSNISASKQIIFTAPFANNPILALQLAPNNKIYCSVYDLNMLYSINNPNSVGISCDVQTNSVDLLGKKGQLGLPSFASSFFYLPAITTTTNCVNVPNTFGVANATNPTSATWNFGDGNTATGLNPSHTYATAGNYTVSVTVTSASGTANNAQNIVIYPQPTASPTATLKQCDDNLDGISTFNLNEAKALLTPNPVGLTFSYHQTQQQAASNTNAIANPSQYTNQTVSNDLVFVRIANANGCYKTAQLKLVVSTTQIPSSFQKTYTECDNTASGSNTDDITAFDFSSAKTQIAALYPPGQLLDITFYKNLADALAETNAISNISNYTNAGYPNTQDIYVRVDSQTNNECLGLGKHITLKVQPIPIVQPQTYTHCDDDQDGKYAFDTTNLQTTLLNGLTNVDVTYKDQNNNPLPSPLPNPFSTVSQTINVNIKSKQGNNCDFNSNITFKVYDLPQAFQPATNTTTVCDDENDPNQQNGFFAFDTTNLKAAVLGNQTDMNIQFYDASNNPLNPLPNPLVTPTQNITAVVTNPLNPSCAAQTTIPFVVQPIPKIQLTGSEQVCSNNPNFTKIIDAGLLDPTTKADFTYIWFFNNTPIPNQTDYTLTVNTEGIYKVQVTNNKGCTKTRTITVNASEKATIENIIINDLTETNSIIVITSGSGIYQYSLDGVVYQDSSTFANISAGIYTVYVKDTKGCGITTNEVSVLGIPKFFTPNGDSYNDYWNIKGISQNFNKSTTIYIFDRFGKLLKQMSALSQGWDGTFNNQPMPADDYWYNIVFEDGRSSKGHFALKR